MGDARERSSRGYVQITDGTNNLPTGDAAARAIVVRDIAQSVVLRTNAVSTVSNANTAVTGLGYARELFVELNVGSASGTAPTLDVYIQTSNNEQGSNNWTDIIHFTQMTSGGVRYATLAGTASPGTAERALQETALAAGTVLQGPFGDALRVNSVIGGTTPSFTYYVYVYIK